MDNLARKLDGRAVTEEFADVVAIGDFLELDTSVGRIRARRAASCLLLPSVGDRVLCAINGRGEAYVLAVLERADESKATLAVEGSVTLRASERLSLVGHSGVDVVGSDVRIAAASVEVAAMNTRLAGHALEVVSEVVNAELGRAKVVAQSIDGILDRFTQRVKRSFRWVEETDQVRARHISYAAEEVTHLRGETTVVTARDLVKVNGEQIHVG